MTLLAVVFRLLVLAAKIEDVAAAAGLATGDAQNKACCGKSRQDTTNA